MKIPRIGTSHVTASILVVRLHHINAQVNRDLEGPWRTRPKALDGSARAHNPKVAGSNPAPATNQVTR